MPDRSHDSLTLDLTDSSHISPNTHHCLNIPLDFVAQVYKLADTAVHDLIKCSHTWCNNFCKEIQTDVESYLPFKKYTCKIHQIDEKKIYSFRRKFELTCHRATDLQLHTNSTALNYMKKHWVINLLKIKCIFVSDS